MLSGQPPVPSEIERTSRARFTLLGGARNLAGLAVAGIDMAAWDALACLVGMPLATLLGGRRDAIPAYRSLGMLTAERAPEEAEKAVEDGYRGVKVKVGWPTLEDDLRVVRAMRKHLADDVDLMVDYNQSLTVVDAIERGRALDAEGVAWIEEPVRCDDFTGCAQVAAAVETPIQLGENFAGPFDLQAALRAEASGLLMPDIQQIGGVSGWMRGAALAHAAGKKTSSHVFIEFSAHMLSVTPTRHWLEYLDMAGAVLAEPFVVSDGPLQAPARPGAGLVWDEAAVARFAAA